MAPVRAVKPHFGVGRRAVDHPACNIMDHVGAIEVVGTGIGDKGRHCRESLVIRAPERVVPLDGRTTRSRDRHDHSPVGGVDDDPNGRLAHDVAYGPVVENGIPASEAPGTDEIGPIHRAPLVHWFARMWVGRATNGSSVQGCALW
jgi:hypothetical protein